MQREIVCDILALAAPDSMLKGYAQCWVDLVQAMQPGQGSQEAVSLARLIAEHSCCPRLSFHVGAAAAPIISQGMPGMPSAKLAGRVLSIYMRPKHNLWRHPKFDGIISLLAGMLSAAPGATMGVVSLERWPGCGCWTAQPLIKCSTGLQAQQDDTREEVRLSQEAEMLGWGAVMLQTCTEGRTEADTWFEWIYHTDEMGFGLDTRVLAMSLTRAMFEHVDTSSRVTNLLACFLLKQENPNQDDLLDFNDKKIFERLLVGALLAGGIKIVKKDT